MAKTSARTGNGSTIGYRTVGSGGAYTAIAEVKKIMPPEVEWEKADAMHLASDSNAEEYVAAFIKSGKADLELNYTKAQCATLYAILISGTDYEWQITLSDSSTCSWTGFLSKGPAGGGEVERKNVITGKYEVQVSTGVPVFASS